MQSSRWSSSTSPASMSSPLSMVQKQPDLLESWREYSWQYLEEHWLSLDTFVPSPGAAIAGWFLVSLGGAVFGVVNGVSGVFDSIFVVDINHFLFFIPLLTLSPGIFIFIKLQAIMKKADNKFVQRQATYGNRAEAILEAAPQLCLQLYIIFLNVSHAPTEK